MERMHRFVDSLGKLDRKARAELRRSLAFEPATYPPAYPYVEPFVARDDERRWFYLLAGLYALHGQGSLPPSGVAEGRSEGQGPTLGSAAAELYVKRGRSPSIEQRFVVLLDADSEQLPHRLRQMVTLLRTEQVSLDWRQLLKDLLYWNHERRFVQQRWAKGFYRVPQNDEAPENNKGGSDT